MNRTITNQFRVEEDALGDVQVPADHLWGAQTQRSHVNFPIGVERFRWGRPVIRALGILKKCAALANGRKRSRGRSEKFLPGDAHVAYHHGP